MEVVSTHSRLKAAGRAFVPILVCISSFNTQPPKGGWAPASSNRYGLRRFNTQPPKGGWFSFKFH